MKKHEYLLVGLGIVVAGFIGYDLFISHRSPLGRHWSTWFTPQRDRPGNGNTGQGRQQGNGSYGQPSQGQNQGQGQPAIPPVFPSGHGASGGTGENAVGDLSQ